MVCWFTDRSGCLEGLNSVSGSLQITLAADILNIKLTKVLRNKTATQGLNKNIPLHLLFSYATFKSVLTWIKSFCLGHCLEFDKRFCSLCD
jgi:hypothetical protein